MGMSGRLEGKVAIVTGAGRGIGEAIALRFAHEGAKVVAVQRTPEDGERLVSRIKAEGGDGIAVAADVQVPASVEAMVGMTIEAYGRLDILCNNAGHGGVSSLPELSMEHYDAVMETNVRGVLLCMKYGITPMLEKGAGSIINIASVASYIGLPKSAVYCASKGAVLALTRQAALDFAPHGIRVNAVAPGYIATPMFYSYCDVQPDPQAALNEVMSATPMGRLGTPDDVAGAVLYFASDDSRWVTGTSLVVDGGLLCL
jgi:NAD(P)-dependent dehydrogenase (short-subunit alcohol dehydrogenase family)